MGGISDGQAFLDQDKDTVFARLTGNVSTKNNGGFIQLRSTLSFVNINNIEKKLKVFASTLREMVKLIIYLFAQAKLDPTVISIMLLLLQMRNGK